MKHLVLFFCFLSGFSFAQTATIKGVVTDKASEGILPFSYVKLSKEFIVIADVNGAFSFSNVPFGKYTLLVASDDLDTLFLPLTIDKSLVIVNPKLGGSMEIEEVKIIANLVTDRKTPVPLTKISAEKIAQELGSRDLPMLLNATPGVFATQSGGGDGDSRVVVRGFDQRNIGVLIDGVPVNDMENGQVYWSNWFGLDAITSQVQVQRGLGVTKLSMPSVGGSMNIVTSGIGGKKGITFKQEYGTATFLRSSLTYNSGLMKNNFGVTVSGSYKQGNGWVQGTPTQGAFYYAKVQKKLEKHLISFSVFGAPQKHGQRSGNSKQTIHYWDSIMARDLGYNGAVSTTGFVNKGINFSENWGKYVNENGDTIVKNDRSNFYHKPQITLKDFWVINKKLSVSNIGYMSIGRGGGTRLLNTSGIKYNTDGTINWFRMVKDNQVGLFGPTIDLLYSPTELKASQVQIASMNNHFWVGYLGQFNYEMSKEWNFAGGLDYRFYKGQHFQEITDMLGGDYFVSNSNVNENDPNKMLRKGDKVALNTFNNNRDGLVNWAGVFGSAEYSGTRWTAFMNLSGVINAYKGIDYFEKKQLVLSDTTLRFDYNDTINYKGETYTANSEDVDFYQTKWKTIPGATIKLGASYRLSEESVVFTNIGILSRTPQFSNVIDNNTNAFFYEIENEKIQALEFGYNYIGKRIGFNINTYATNWQNKPFPFGVAVPDPQDPTTFIYVNVNGMDAIHLGGEVDIAYNISKKISAEFMFSFGDWRWNSAETVEVEELNLSYTFDAKGVHVGNSAQTMLNLGMRYEPIKNLYFKAQYQWFDRYYSEFNPFSLSGLNAGKESWKLPSWGNLNLFAGYSKKIQKVNLFFNGNITNLLNTKFIADANNNGTDGLDTFDINSATVLFGQGFRFNLTMGLQF